MFFKVKEVWGMRRVAPAKIWNFSREDVTVCDIPYIS
jgi:hypothetical protein